LHTNLVSGECVTVSGVYTLSRLVICYNINSAETGETTASKQLSLSPTNRTSCTLARHVASMIKRVHIADEISSFCTHILLLNRAHDFVIIELHSKHCCYHLLTAAYTKNKKKATVRLRVVGKKGSNAQSDQNLNNNLR